MPEPRRTRGMVDTSVLIDPPPESALPEEASVSAITLAELVAGVHATHDPNERAARQDRLQRVQATLEALPFDADANIVEVRDKTVTWFALRKLRPTPIRRALHNENP